MIEVKPMDERYIHIDCLHNGPVDPSVPPTRGRLWQDAPDLPPHPWSDDMIADVAKKYRRITEGWGGEPSREFMREMIQRYGTCAMLAWENGEVVGQLRFYPLTIVQLLARMALDKQEVAGSKAFEPDPETLWIRCVMTSRPYVWRDKPSSDGHWPSMVDAGARKGTGLKLVKGFIDWASDHGWKRAVKLTNADLDFFYGQTGGAGKAFWEKAGFKVIGTSYEEWPKDDNWKTTVESQAKAKGMSKKEAWTVYHIACDL